MDTKIQELTDKIYREGVEKGNEEAGRIIAEANAQKESIVKAAEEQAAQIVAEAEQEALKFIDRTPESLVDEYGAIPADFVGAILIRVSTRFENRGEFTQKAVNPIVANTWENVLMKYVNPESL